MHSAADHTSFPAGLTFALVLVTLVYVRGWLKLRRAAPASLTSLSMGRVGMFVLGLGVLWIAVAAPLGALGVIGHGRISSHMVRHVLIGAVAPPLIWLSAPMGPLLLGLANKWPLPLVSSDPLASLGRLLTHPFTAWLAGVLTVIGWHVPAAFEFAQQSESWHAIQIGSFFVTGLLFWWPVVQPWPAIARLPRTAVPLYLFAATLPCDALSAFLVFCDRVVYPQNTAESLHIQASALADQQTAGALMWVSITFLYLVPALVMTVQTFSPTSAVSRIPRV
jgi:cytochrome c oxidase assembly factor CtaG